jgi:flagellar basal-body rod modification protein FlgD
MATSGILPGVGNQVVAGKTTGGQTILAPGHTSDSGTVAGNFTQFLQLLTTQLQNQNPLDPLDTNQFTQQLVQFAQVEQQLKSNDQLSTLVSLQKITQQSQALGFVGTTVSVDGSTAILPQDGKAGWSFNAPKPATAIMTVTNSTGATVFSGTYTVQAGIQDFQWDGRSNNGAINPPGKYALSIVAQDASKNPVAISTEVQGVVNSVDMTQDPPVLSIGGQEFTLDKIKRVTKTASSS